MRLIKSIVIAFSMFSILPVPTLEWNEKDMRYVMLAFPILGAVIGAIFILWYKLVIIFDFGIMIKGLGFLLIPILITGGVHLDGLSDTSDALASHSSKEEKARILKDSHIGAFGVISLCVYLISFFALAAEVPMNLSLILCLAFAFIISRSLAGIAILTFPCSSETGLAKTFSSTASRKICLAFIFILLIISFCLCIYFAGLIGVMVIFFSLITFICYRFILVRSFGGNNGDLTGWFLQICEVVLLATIVVFGKVFEVIL